MTDVQHPDSTVTAHSPDSGFKLSQDALAAATVVGVLIYCVANAIITWAEDLERRHHRAQLLAAYRKRHKWKKSDLPHLRSLGVNQAAQSRMERLTGTGRPVTKRPQPLDQLVLEKFEALQLLFDPEATPTERRQALKFWPWWPHHVEALYRGEHARAKELGVRNPSIEAEILVGRALGISAPKVHAISGEIRRMRKEDPESANFPPMTLAEFDRWMETGQREFPKSTPKLESCIPDP
jgi:hypothetical protein